jgi:hypothetical protein
MNIYEIKTAIHFQNLLAGIDNLWENFPEFLAIKYKEYGLFSSEGQYGFSLKSNFKETELFIGLWMDYWVTFGIPCVITLETTSSDNANAKKELEKMVTEFPEYFEKVHFYNQTLVLPIKKEFIVNLEKHEPVVYKIKEFVLKSSCFQK